MPRSVLMGRVVEPGEPLWLAEDLEAVLEWQRWCDLVCSGCGQPMSETLDPELEGAYEATAVVCHGCAARETEQQRVEGKGVHVAVDLDPRARQFLIDRRKGVNS